MVIEEHVQKQEEPISHANERQQLGSNAIEIEVSNYPQLPPDSEVNFKLLLFNF